MTIVAIMHLQFRFKNNRNNTYSCYFFLNNEIKPCFISNVLQHYGRHRAAVPLAYTVSVMTLWKTVHYFLMYYEFLGSTNYRKGNPFWDEVLLVFIPNVVWVILPVATMAVLWNRITPSRAGDDVKKGKGSKKTR